MWELLQDGRWHTNAELSSLGVGRPNSRAAELRTRHHAQIDHDFDPAAENAQLAHRYRLVVDPPATADGQLLLLETAA